MEAINDLNNELTIELSKAKRKNEFQALIDRHTHKRLWEQRT